jgi:hypothetical protein
MRQEGNTSKQAQFARIKKYCEERNLNPVRLEHLTESAKDSKSRIKYQEIIAYALP